MNAQQAHELAEKLAKAIDERQDDFTDGAQFYLHTDESFEQYLYDLIRGVLADHE